MGWHINLEAGRIKKILIIMVMTGIVAIMSTGIRAEEKSSVGMKKLRNPSILEAAKKGDLESIQYLLEWKPELVNLEPYAAVSPLCYAAANGHKEAAELLIKYAANVTSDCRPLVMAEEAGYADIVQFLLERGASESIYEVSYLGRLSDIERLLQKDITLIRAMDKDEWTALHYAARGGATEACQLLIEKGALIDAQTKEDKLTPLMLAVKKGHIATATLLLANGADVNAQHFHSYTALHYAKNAEMMELLLKNGADVNARCDPYSWTPLQKIIDEDTCTCTSMNDCKDPSCINTRDMCTILLKNGADTKEMVYIGRRKMQEISVGEKNISCREVLSQYESKK